MNVYLWRVDCSDRDEEGNILTITVTIYDRRTRQIIEILYVNEFPNINSSSIIQFLRKDLNISVCQYKNIPDYLNVHVRAAISNNSTGRLDQVLFERLIHSIFLERSIVPKRAENLKDMGHTFH